MPLFIALLVHPHILQDFSFRPIFDTADGHGNDCSRNSLKALMTGRPLSFRSRERDFDALMIPNTFYLAPLHCSNSPYNFISWPTISISKNYEIHHKPLIVNEVHFKPSIQQIAFSHPCHLRTTLPPTATSIEFY